MLDRFDPADAEQVVDQAAGARAPGGDPHAHVAHQVADGGDGEEVGRVAEVVDDGQLVVQPPLDPLDHGVAGPGVAGGDGSQRPLTQHRAGGLVGTQTQDGGLGQVHRPDTEVGARVEHAARGQRRGVVEQPTGLLVGEVTTTAEGGCHLGRGAGHRRTARQVAHRGDPVEVPGVEGHQSARGVEHVDGGRPRGVGVPDGAREHCGHTGLAGQGEHPASVVGAHQSARRTVVADHLDGQRPFRQHRPPPGQHGVGQIGAPGQHRPTHLAGGAEQDDESRLTGGRSREAR